MRDRVRSVIALSAWMVFLALALVWLHALGDGPLSAPTWRGFGGWLDRRDAATAAFAIIRVGLLAVGWYLLAATVLATTLRLVRLGSAAHAIEACSPAPVRRLVRAAVGLSLAASVVAVSAAAASEGPDPVITMQRLPDDPDGVVTMTRLPDDAPPPPGSETCTVVAGDHVWAIARRTLEAAWHRTPTDREIDPYWRALVEHNRSNFLDRNNPDLVVPGQKLDVLPPPPAP